MENKIDERRLFTLINSFPGIVYECLNQKDWPMSFVSQGALELTGYPAESFFEPECRLYSSLILPEYREMVWEEVQRALKEHRIFQIEYKITTADGQHKWVFEQGQGVYDETGSLMKLEGFISDISEKKLAEEALKKSEVKYRTLSESMGVGIWQIDTDFQTMYINKAMCSYIGINAASEIIDKSISGYFTQESFERIKSTYHLRSQNISSSYEVQLVRKDGTIRDFLIYGAPLFDSEGRFYSYLGTFVDITGQKAINEALINSEERFRALFENSHVAQAISRNGLVIQVNHLFAELLGYASTEETIGKHVSEFISLPQRNEVKEKIRLRSEGVEVPTSYELTAIRKGKGEFPILADLGYLELPDGKATIITIKDITEAKIAEKQLRDSEAKFRSLFESSLMGIVISKETGHILEFNNAFASMLGYNEEDFANKMPNWKELTPPEYAELDNAGLKEIAETGIMKPFEKEFIRKDGTRVSVIIGASLLGAERNGVTFVIDISELKKSQKQLEATNKELNTFLYMASHDLKGPLASVVGLTQIAKDENKDPNLSKYIDMILQSTTKLDRSLMNLLKIMKIKEGVEQAELVDFKEIIKEVKESLKELNGYNDVKILSEINQSSEFYSNTGILNSVIQNLVENSIKYRSTQNGAPFVSINISEIGDNIVIQVEDNGRGIDQRIKDRVFDMFYRGTSDSKGSGLGLYIVKNAVEKINGKIDVNARKEGGTIFTIVLPKALPAEKTNTIKLSV